MKTMVSTYTFHILVTDKNHHVRSLLQRELDREGYITYGVDSSTSAYSHILSGVPLDLIILDPELFRPNHLDLFREIVHGTPAIPIILHTYSDMVHVPKGMPNIHLIDKAGDSIETIKRLVHSLGNGSPANVSPL